VVVAIMGGAFIIGHRGYNAQLGLQLMDSERVIESKVTEVLLLINSALHLKAA